MERLKPYINGRYVESETEKCIPIMNPSDGTQIAEAPCCTLEEVRAAVKAASDAYPGWKNTPPHKRAQCLFRLRNLIEEHLDELTMLVAKENGKNWSEAKGDVGKAREMTEFACGIPSLMMGESLMNTSSGYDTTRQRESMGVFAGIAPWNFPAMIPMGWMAPLAVACGNTYVLKAASTTPMTALRMADLYREAGFPDGVLNVVTCSRREAEYLLEAPEIKGITLVGSTEVGRHIYELAARNGKRVQCLCEAKNHALVLEDVPIEQAAQRIMNSAFGCAGERCMALSALTVQESIADKLVQTLVELCRQQKIGSAYEPATNLGPVGSLKHKQFIENWITKGIEEGAMPVLDGRGYVVKGFENGYYVGHTILDHVTEQMSVGTREIFGPVLCVKRVSGFEEGLALMNRNPFANGSVIFTQNGHYAREFAMRTDGGMVGINVGIPVPVGIFPFSGHKQSFFGDLHCHGKDAIRFFTESKTITTYWFHPETEQNSVGTWEGSGV